MSEITGQIVMPVGGELLAGDHDPAVESVYDGSPPDALLEVITGNVKVASPEHLAALGALLISQSAGTKSIGESPEATALFHKVVDKVGELQARGLEQLDEADREAATRSVEHLQMVPLSTIVKAPGNLDGSQE
jgi:hypothetical protein